MDTDASSNRQRAWNSYWSSGELHSCVGSYGGNYAGAVAAFWKSRFAALEGSERILDLATGNGALPLLLLDCTGRDSGVEVDAVDAATISPSWHDLARHPGVRFHAGIAMESLPFADASFDLVASQYGIEYAAWPEALAEAVRVCKPGGSAAFVLHHAESVLVRVGRLELANHEMLLAEDGLLSAAREVLPWIAKARAGQELAGEERAIASRRRYNEAMTAVAGAIESSPVPDLLVQARDAIHGVLSNARGDCDQALASLDDFRIALEAAVLRTGEMIEHALDEAKVEAMHETMRHLRPAWSFRAEPIVQEQGVLGWGVVLEPGGKTPG